MIPDKIYISHLCDTTIDGEEGHLMAMSFEDNGGEKFIRKDALMEKLEKAAASYKKRSDEGELVWQNMCGINEAINILNEM